MRIKCKVRDLQAEIDKAWKEKKEENNYGENSNKKHASGDVRKDDYLPKVPGTTPSLSLRLALVGVPDMQG